ncbi:hypothetical protein, conserved in T. vivax, partial [Trypanosoma vivax Y486]
MGLASTPTTKPATPSQRQQHPAARAKPNPRCPLPLSQAAAFPAAGSHDVLTCNLETRTQVVGDHPPAIFYSHFPGKNGNALWRAFISEDRGKATVPRHPSTQANGLQHTAECSQSNQPVPNAVGEQRRFATRARSRRARWSRQNNTKTRFLSAPAAARVGDNRGPMPSHNVAAEHHSSRRIPPSRAETNKQMCLASNPTAVVDQSRCRPLANENKGGDAGEWRAGNEINKQINNGASNSASLPVPLPKKKKQKKKTRQHTGAQGAMLLRHASWADSSVFCKRAFISARGPQQICQTKPAPSTSASVKTRHRLPSYV